MRTVLLICVAIVWSFSCLAQGWGEHLVNGDFGGANSVEAGDIDGDGDMDIVGAAGEDDDVVWFENVSGDGLHWVEHIVHGGFTDASHVQAVDVDLDGDIDILACTRFGSRVSWWENLDGAGLEWEEQSVIDYFYDVFSTYAADMDGDGDLDFIASSGWWSQIRWLENLNGEGTLLAEHFVDDDSHVYYTHVADIDGEPPLIFRRPLSKCGGSYGTWDTLFA